jgi:hypothetical protein
LIGAREITAVSSLAIAAGAAPARRRMKMVHRNERRLLQILVGIDQPYSLNIQAKYETFSSGRSYSLSCVSGKEVKP